MVTSISGCAGLSVVLMVIVIITGYQWLCMVISGSAWLSVVLMVISGYHWLSVVVHGYMWFLWLLWLSVVGYVHCGSYGYQWLCMVISGCAWLSVVVDGYQWLCTVIGGYAWLYACLSVICMVRVSARFVVFKVGVSRCFLLTICMMHSYNH